MKSSFSVSIPKPCHEDWNTMTPKDKGRFCASCSKVVIDFTKMNPQEIQDYIKNNQHKRICGHFKQSQLDSINLRIPIQNLTGKSFRKAFLLALLISMGTSIISCTNKHGQTQKIDSVEIIDSISNKVVEIDSITENTKDTISDENCKAKKTSPKEKKLSNMLTTDGMIKVDKISNNDTVIAAKNIEVIEYVGDIDYSEDNLVGFVFVESPPEFKNTPQDISVEQKRAYFNKQIGRLFTKKFNHKVFDSLNLKEPQRVYTLFEIDEKGSIQNIKVKSPHPKIDEEVKRLLKSLPQFIPAKQNNNPISISYALPIIFDPDNK